MTSKVGMTFSAGQGAVVGVPPSGGLTVSPPEGGTPTTAPVPAENVMPTLLVIDDEQSVRYSLRRVLEGGDVRVLTAATGAEGLQQVRDANPDVVVLDLQLPDCSGLEVFRDLQDQDTKRPVIFITAHGT